MSGNLAFQARAADSIVINEIHYNPDVKTERVEFIELYNAGTNVVNLAGWSFSAGITYTFGSTNIAPGGYLVVAQNPAALFTKFGATSVGPYTGGFSKYGEKVTLRNAAGDVVDEVDYQLGFPWPTVGEPPGYSIELLNPTFDNSLAGSWRASLVGTATAGSSLLINETSSWKYVKGTNEASAPTTAWRALNFDDALWPVGNTPIGYDPGIAMNTPLPDMNNNYTSFFIRKKFVVNDLALINTLTLEALYDDGFKLWINGSNVVNASMPAGEAPFYALATGTARESANYDAFALNGFQNYLVAGTNIIAVQVHNLLTNGSSDCYFDCRLRASTGSGDTRGPTPGRLNSIFAGNIPPQIRQVDHSPAQPAAAQPVTVTAKVTDPDGVAGVTLEYQIVNPGSYIEITDSAYTNVANWVSLSMNDAGTGGDALAGDDEFTAVIPGSVQQHRRLIRYRIAVADTGGRSVRVPYADDPQPNFAYFCYNGVPEWRGAVQPGAGGANGVVATYSSNVMSRLPVYHLIGKSNSVATATWFSRYGGDLYQWAGTLVYDGKVYDNIHYRARGGVWRYSMCKNMWKFDLNRGHDFEARDNWGRKYKTGWTKVNLGASIQQGNFNHRGEQGMLESVGFRMFQLAGVEAPNTTFVTFRVIDDALEADPASQYEGDFWGVYLAIEQEDGRYLEEHDLPDSNLYKMEGGTGELNNIGENGPTDKSDLNAILPQSNTGRAESWWATNWNLPKYYSYQAIAQGIHHYDICYDKNFFYFNNSDTRLWEIFSWDLDLTWADNMYDAGCGGKDRVYQRVFDETTPAKPNIAREWRNRIREVRDLFFNSDEAWRLVDEYAALLRGPTNAPTILDADRSMWDYNPKMVSSTYTPNVNDKAGHGRYYAWPEASESFATKNFNGCIQILKAYVNRRGSNTLDVTATEPLRPNRPTVTYTGPVNYPINRLTFRSSNFSTPSPTNVFGSMKWRVGEVSTNAPSYDEPEAQMFEITARWEQTNNTFIADVTVPPGVVRVGSRYRVRVQHTDDFGRRSNWSLPHEFTCGEPEDIADLLNYLRITEIMFNPPPGGFEYIELHNSSATATLDLAGVKFTQGVDFTCGAGVTMPPGGYLLVIGTTNVAAFRAYYGLDGSVAILAAYDGSLNNAGEQLTLRTAAGGTDILSFDYRDGRGWPVAADGAGHSLVLLDSAEAQQRSTTGDSGTAEYGGNWRMSTYLRGSPGRADAPPPVTIVLNEIVAHTDFTNEITSNDWIELFNTTDTNITFGPGWFLSDDASDLQKWQIPAATTIAARGWVSFDEATGFHMTTNAGFGLNKGGEQVFLSYLPGTAADRVVDAVSFKAQENDWSLGRYPDGGAFWHALTPRTRDTTNAMPTLGVVITEIMYHPTPIGGTNDNTLDEFIEVHNPTGNAVDLFNTNGAWRLDGVAGDGNFDLPPNLTLTAGEYLLIVNFNPTNVAQLNIFRATYGISNLNLKIAGPYSGKLANNSARLALEKPQSSDPPGGTPDWVIADEVIFADQSPWPCGSDGDGNSLQRVSPLAHGNDPANWSAQSPTPGAARVPLPAGVPSITAQPASRNVGTNTSVSFSVSVCGTPPYSYQWRHDGTNLPGATNAALTLNNVQPSDAGDYTVVVSNAAGSAISDPATLIVQFPPYIVTPPQPATVVRGQTATFNASAAGTPPLSYQWQFNGANLPGQTNGTLVLTNVQGSQQGNYAMVAQNSAGSVASVNAFLTVNIPATITNQPVSRTVTNGTAVTFTVGAVGTGTLLYQWRFNGANIDGATSASFTLISAQWADVGTYIVVVTDTIGTDTSQPATLFVLARPAIEQQPTPASQTIPVGSTVTLTMSVSNNSTLPMSYRWRRGGTSITNIVLNSHTCVLTLPNIQTVNAGSWTCVPTNLAGAMLNYVGQIQPGLTLAGVITVVAPVSITLQPTNQTVEPGSNATFVAAATGGTPLGFRWYFNGTNLIAGATNASLTISNAQAANAGGYTFVASNSVSAATSQVAMLTLPLPPTILTPPTSQSAPAGSNATFTVNATGQPPLSYQWTYAGTNLPGATNVSLLLTNLQYAQAGDYSVTVSNPLGATNSDPATLTVTDGDADGDGMLDSWEAANGLSSSNPNDGILDADNDGLTNAQEHQAGTNPTNALSYLKIDNITRDAGANPSVQITFYAVSNRAYSVLCHTNALTPPLDWTPVAQVSAAPTNRVVIVTNQPPATPPERFYRLVTPQRQ